MRLPRGFASLIPHPARANTRAGGWRGSSIWFARPAPRRGSKIVAQRKATEAAALGKEPPHPTSFFPSGLARRERAKPEGKKERSLLWVRNPGRRCACPGLLSYRPYGTSVWLAPLALSAKEKDHRLRCGQRPSGRAARYSARSPQCHQRLALSRLSSAPSGNQALCSVPSGMGTAVDNPEAKEQRPFAFLRVWQRST
jgi:hypothetical protein